GCECHCDTKTRAGLTCCERPRCCRAAEQRDELSSLHTISSLQTIEMHSLSVQRDSIADFRGSTSGSLHRGISRRPWTGLGQNPNASPTDACPVPSGADISPLALLLRARAAGRPGCP